MSDKYSRYLARRMNILQDHIGALIAYEFPDLEEQREFGNFVWRNWASYVDFKLEKQEGAQALRLAAKEGAQALPLAAKEGAQTLRLAAKEGTNV